MKRKTNGFTLIEMLIVVAIIGIIATIALISVTRARKRAVATKGKAAMVEMVKGMEMAASEGCRYVDFTKGSGEAVLGCNGTTVSYATVPGAPGGLSYAVNVDGSEVTSSGETGEWSGSIVKKSTSGTYIFTVSGFENAESFTCTEAAGCKCTIADGCKVTQ